MIRFLARRLLAVVPVLFLVSIGVFLLQALVPGDPAILVAGGEAATPEEIARVRHELLLDQPVVVRYLHWVGPVLRGDLGNSIFNDDSVMGQIKARAPITGGMILAATFIAIVIGVPFGVLAGSRPGGLVDRLSRSISSLAVAIPGFVLAIALILLLSVRYRVLPALGYTPIAANPVDWLRHMLMPATVLGLSLMATFSRQLRSSFVDTMSSNHIRACFARGGSRGRVIWKHGLKNSAIPAITVLGVHIASLLGGTIILERIFSIPGMGPYVLQAIQRGDYPVVQGVALFFALTQVAVSLALDAIYGLLNPRVRVN